MDLTLKLKCGRKGLAMTVRELIIYLIDSYDMNMNVYVYYKLEENYIPIKAVEIANNVYLQTED